MGVDLAWLGVSTFRLQIDEVVVFLDAYVDRVPAAPPVGLASADIERADWILVGHSHFDHLWGASTIARNTGATIVGSYETARIMEAAGVPRHQLLAVSGGEPVRLGDSAVVHALPGLHSCLWARQPRGDNAAADECLGDTELVHQDRLLRMRGRAGTQAVAERPAVDPDVASHLQESNQGARGDGGALAYLVDTADGSIFWNDTSGCWTGVLRDVRPDVAILAAAGRANVDGEPVQGSLADFVGLEAELLRPRRLLVCHHDDWMPPRTRAIDTAPIRDAVAAELPGCDFLELGYNDDEPVLKNL